MTDSKPGRILIVDDEIDVLGPLRDFLTELGYEVTGYVSAKEALESLKEKDFDLLLTDLVLPEIDGISLLKSARKLAPHLICIVITGQGTIESAVEAMKVGAFDYITKPLDWKILRTNVSRAVEVARLRKSEEKYRAIVEDQTEFICRWRPGGMITFVNEVICRYFGMPCDELIGSTCERFLPSEEYEELKRRTAILNKENPVAFMEHKVIMPGGEIRWQQWSNRAIFDEQGRTVEFQSVGRDITERRRAEEALRESEERYRLLIETMNEGLGVRDEKGIITFVNEKLTRMMGYAPGEMPGRHIEDFLDEGNKRILREQMERRKSGEATSYELTWTRKNGEKIITVVSPMPFFDEKGNFKGSFAVFTDITARKRTEEERRLSEEELRSSHEQLRALSVRLSKAEESERKRISRELHDQVGQNLTALGINLNMLRVRLSDILTPEIDSRLNDSLNLLEETVTKIRDVMTDLRPSVLDDYGLMAAIRWYSEQFSKRTGVEIVVDGYELKPRLSSEVEITLFRIVQELLTNVAKHAMASRVTVSLVEEGERVSLTIGDNGIGLDPMVSDRSGEERGWGLLNIRERAESIGGRLTVESNPGRGTRVEIDIGR